jgi:hypothetical protein
MRNGVVNDMADTKEKVICPWCGEEMKPYPHQGYYWFECKCGARTPTLWHATQEQARKRALSYAADVVPKSTYDLAVAEREANVKGFAVELEAMRGAANSYKMHYENLAREIFEEIERAIEDAELEWGTIFGVKLCIAELKKKYTE